MKNNKLIIILLILILGLSIQTTKVIIPNEKKDYKAANFESEALYSCVQSALSNAGLTEEQLGQLTELSCHNNIEIDSAEGIQDLTGLTSLDLSYNSLTEIDLSENKLLKNLNLSGNEFTEIDLSENDALEVLKLGKNRLKALDLSDLTALTLIDLHDNDLTTLDLSGKGNLKSIDASGNVIEAIVFPTSAPVNYLDLSANELKSVNLKGFPNLVTALLSINYLTALDVTTNTKLEVLHCSNNELKTIDLSNNNLLVDLDLYNNKLTSIDIKNLTSLIALNLSLNKLTEIDLSRNTELVKLYISSNKLDKLTLTNNNKLKELNAVFNNFKSYTIPNKALIDYLAIDYDWIKDFDLSSYTSLKQLDINKYINLSIAGDKISMEQVMAQFPKEIKFNDYGVYKNYDMFNPTCEYVEANDDGDIDPTSNEELVNGKPKYKVVKLENTLTTSSGTPKSYECLSPKIKSKTITSNDTSKIQINSINFRIDGFNPDAGIKVQFNAYVDLNYLDDGSSNHTTIANVPNTGMSVAHIAIIGLLIIGAGTYIVYRGVKQN